MKVTCVISRYAKENVPFFVNSHLPICYGTPDPADFCLLYFLLQESSALKHKKPVNVYAIFYTCVILYCYLGKLNFALYRYLYLGRVGGMI